MHRDIYINLYISIYIHININYMCIQIIFFESLFRMKSDRVSVRICSKKKNLYICEYVNMYNRLDIYTYVNINIYTYTYIHIYIPPSLTYIYVHT
jgi:hypothetical protein